MPDGPIQVVLNPERFRDQRPPGSGGGGKDFYQGEDAAFAAHRDALALTIDQILDGRPADSALNVLVTMRPDALAKSHRPFGILFRPSRASHVGTAEIGELIFRVRVRDLGEIRRLVAGSEIAVATRPNARGVQQYSPSPARCETGAIESVEVWVPATRRGWSLDQGEEWLQSDGSGQRAEVELLEVPRRRELHHEAVLDVRRTLELIEGHEDFVTPARALARFGIQSGGSEVAASSNTTFRQTLRLVESSLAVKRVRLQDKILSPEEADESDGDSFTLPPAGGTRPVVGLIDGGVAGPLASLVVGRSDVVAQQHKTPGTVNHASLVMGLLRLGSGLNSFLEAAEDCDVYDIGMFPSKQFVGLYYEDLDSLMDQIRADVQQAKRSHGVRVFNLSWNLMEAPGSGGYSLAAQALDNIALELDVIFVVSAGNLDSTEVRPEWPPSDLDALAGIASSTADDRVLSPSESIANVGVGAVNPPGMPIEIEGAPTRYTRRGRNNPSAVKPDLAAVGGSAPDSARADTGLHSMNAFGNNVPVRGTSYAAPLVARHLASLDLAISSYASRELLIALTVHHAKVPPIMTRKAFKDVASSFVGHGLPRSVAESLEGDSYCMTMVLADRLLPGKRVDLPFSWPPSLTTPDGKCRGEVRLTLVAKPQMRYAHGRELVRVNLDAALKQADRNGDFERRTVATHEFFSGYRYAREKSLATELGKWFPIKSYAARMPRGKGFSTDWKLEVSYLTRALEEFPEDGLDFAVVLSIEDMDRVAPVHDEMRVSLSRTGVQLADLRTAVRVTT